MLKIIENEDLLLKTWTFPAGERGVSVEGVTNNPITIFLDFESSNDLIDLMLLSDVLHHKFRPVPKVLYIPYFPYARQDRRMNDNESHSLKVIARMINSCSFDEVIVDDAHSDVLEAVLDNATITPQYVTALKALEQHKHLIDVLIAPDAGAAKKIYKLAEVLHKPVIVASKKRDIITGSVVQVVVSELDRYNLQSKNAWVIDDICDGGATFIELAKVLHGQRSLNLYVTHGIFSKGTGTLKRYYNEIVCWNDMSKTSKENTIAKQ